MSQPKNLRRIPDWISDKIAKIKPKPVVAGCVKKIPASDIRTGKYSHLGISWANGKPTVNSPIVPDAKNGRYSSRNADGFVVIRKDLPMIKKSFSFQTPNWGDWYRGSHETHFERDAYQREDIAPRENEISVEVLGKEAGIGDDKYAFKFVVSEVMSADRRGFKDDLFFNLNLLQENVGACDVFPSDATVDDYLKTVYVDWEILPPGERDQNIRKILRSVGDTPQIREKIKDRYDFFENLKPEAFIQGLGGFRRYFGAKFANDLVVFENMAYGNAIYVMFGDWAKQSQKTKQELLSSGRQGSDFERVPHTRGWKGTVREIIKQRRKK